MKCDRVESGRYWVKMAFVKLGLTWTVLIQNGRPKGKNWTVFRTWIWLEDPNWTVFDKSNRFSRLKADSFKIHRFKGQNWTDQKTWNGRSHFDAKTRPVCLKIIRFHPLGPSILDRIHHFCRSIKTILGNSKRRKCNQNINDCLPLDLFFRISNDSYSISYRLVSANQIS